MRLTFNPNQFTLIDRLAMAALALFWPHHLAQTFYDKAIEIDGRQVGQNRSKSIKIRIESAPGVPLPKE